MPRAKRVKGNDIHYHVVMRCNNGEFLLREADDFKLLLDLLAEGQGRFFFKLYNYTLLHSHAHLILSTHENHFVDEVMHHLCLNYSREYNKIHKRSGHLWKNRYRCKPILTDMHALACLRYQHRNPDKAGIVARPGEWQWCGYRFYAWSEPNHLLTPHPTYIGLANTPIDREEIYRRFTEAPLTKGECELFEKRHRPSSQFFQKAIRNLVRSYLPFS